MGLTGNRGRDGSLIVASLSPCSASRYTLRRIALVCNRPRSFPVIPHISLRRYFDIVFVLPPIVLKEKTIRIIPSPDSLPFIPLYGSRLRGLPYLLSCIEYHHVSLPATANYHPVMYASFTCHLVSGSSSLRYPIYTLCIPYIYRIDTLSLLKLVAHPVEHSPAAPGRSMFIWEA